MTTKAEALERLKAFQDDYYPVQDGDYMVSFQPIGASEPFTVLATSKAEAERILETMYGFAAYRVVHMAAGSNALETVGTISVRKDGKWIVCG